MVALAITRVYEFLPLRTPGLCRYESRTPVGAGILCASLRILINFSITKVTKFYAITRYRPFLL